MEGLPMDLEKQNAMRNMMKTSYGDEKMDKSSELNDSMTIKNTSADEYTKKIHNIGGNE